MGGQGEGGEARRWVGGEVQGVEPGPRGSAGVCGPFARQVREFAARDGCAKESLGGAAGAQEWVGGCGCTAQCESECGCGGQVDGHGQCQGQCEAWQERTCPCQC